ALGQMVNFLGTLQNEWAGAQAFNNVDTYLAPFVRYDCLSYPQVRQAIQKFVFNLNTTSRWGGQSPFTNLTFDLVPPKHIAGEGVIYGGEITDDSYGDFTPEMEMINKAFLEVMAEGDYHGRIFSFPIPTYNITEDFPWESEVGRLLLKLTSKYGVPYFQNFINSDISPEDVRSMCCRLQMDLRELKKKTGGLFGAGDLTGSIGVVTLKLPKLAFLAQGEEDFLDLITEYASLAKDSLEYKRKVIANNMEMGLFPFSSRYLKNGLRGHFSTIGLIGGHEACLNLLGKGIESEAGLRLMRRALDHLRKLTIGFQEETGNLYNLEATPAEGTSYRLAKIDKSLYSGIVTSGNGVPYYTNSTALPVGISSDVFYALEHQKELQTLYTGGTVFHTFLGEAVADEDALQAYLVKAMSRTKLPYLTVTPTFSVCKEHGYLRGEHFSCPYCGQDAEVYTRVVGYYRPVSRWNKGKQAEYQDRRVFEVAG
ncbi:MAG: ribonucleoside triphosphate reductase, partial [Desulfonatronovibrionaceae bacterium]